MANVLNFRKVEVVGATKAEALAQAPFEIMGDATQAYKNWLSAQTGVVTENDKRQFMLDYLERKSKNVKGAGFSITVDAAVADTRQRPYEITDVKNTDGTRKYKTIYQVVDNESGEIIAEIDSTKAKAKEVVKSLYTDEGYRGDLTCTYIHKVVKGQPVAFTAKYTPSVNAKSGSYIVFGITND